MRWIVCALLLFSISARADAPDPFTIKPRLEVPLLAVGSALWMSSEILKPQLAPEQCGLCGHNVLDDAVQRGLLWENIRPARRLSDALLFGIVPALSLGTLVASSYANGDGHFAREDALVLMESLVLTATITQLTKYTLARERPFLSTQRKNGEVVTHGPDDNLSFFSGHTSITFALAAGAGTIATRRGYGQAAAIWAIGMPLAALTGYLRIASDRHYFTDVLTGAIVGSLVGALVPWLHSRHQD